jgi:hypothetical protein
MHALKSFTHQALQKHQRSKSRLVCLFQLPKYQHQSVIAGSAYDAVSDETLNLLFSMISSSGNSMPLTRA